MKHNGAPPLAAPRSFSPRACAGWSLFELVIVLAVLSVLIYFGVRSYQPQEAIALQQAERLRNDIRNVQMLAINWSQALRVTTTATSYSISCVLGGASPCNGVNPVVNPATGQPYVVNLEAGLTLAGPGFSLDLDTLGRPKNPNPMVANATFTITGGSAARTVVVTPITGFVSAQ